MRDRFPVRREEWIEAAWCTSPEIIKVAKRLAPHLESVVAGHRHGVKLGLVESINSKIAAPCPGPRLPGPRVLQAQDLPTL